MIERFNFYDVYGYLIPGFAWLLLLAIPFHLIFRFAALSATEFTASLVVSYLAGHLLDGLARQFIPSESHEIPGADGKPRKEYRSVAVLWDQYPHADKLSKPVQDALADKFSARFGYDPLKLPFDANAVAQMFFLCRTSLSQAKLASYVEQYQGMNSLTRSLSLAFCTAAVSYTTWTVASAWQLRATSARWIAPYAILVAGGVAAFVVRNAINNDAKRYRKTIASFAVTVENLGLLTILVAVAIAFSRWQPLTLRQCYGLAVAAGACWLIALRLRTASESFDESLVSAVYRDFITLETGRDDRKPKPYCKPDDD